MGALDDPAAELIRIIPGTGVRVMGFSDYSFVDKWRVYGTCEEVTEILKDGSDLHRWWPSIYLKSNQTRKGDAHGIGAYVEMLAQGGRFPYQLNWQAETIETNHPHGFTVRATGDFNGTGKWTFRQDGEWVDVTFEWNIRVDAPVLQVFSPIIKPLLADNHRWAMRRGEESIKLELARRHAIDDEARKFIPPPPGPMVDWPFTLVILGGIVGVFGGGLWVAGKMFRAIRG